MPGYLSAFLIPLHGFVSESINGAFTPKYSAQRETEPHRAAALFSGLYTVLLLISIIVAIGLFVGADLWVAALAPGFDAERRQVATAMLQVLALALPAYVVSGLFASVDLAMGRGGLSASRASIQSLGLILGTLAAMWLGKPNMIAVGFVTSFAVLFIIGRRVILDEGLTLRLVWFLSPEIKSALIEIFKAFRILIWIPIAFQINGIIERRVASLVSEDAMVAVDYARFITETLIILVAMPFGLAGLSTMASMNVEAFRKAKILAFRALLYVGIPLSALLYVNANLIVAIIFERGAFGSHSVDVTAQILSGMAIGIWGQLLGYAGAKFMSARGQNTGALIASLLGVAFSVTTLLFGQSSFGISVLGAAAALQGLVFGSFILWRMEVFRELGLEIFSLILIAISYVFSAEILINFNQKNIWSSVSFAILFWAIFFIALPWHRRTAIEAISLIKNKNKI